jgi:hypothetical protein
VSLANTTGIVWSRKTTVGPGPAETAVVVGASLVGGAADASAGS